MVEDLTLSGSLDPKQSPRTIPILEEYEYDATILHVDINDLLNFDKNSITPVAICDANITASLRLRNFNNKKYLFQA